MTEHSPRPVRVLVADDDPDTRLLLRLALTRAGYDPHPVDSGTAALAAINTTAFAACILDVRMPGINGLHLCRLIKAGRASAHIPVIILSAQVDDGSTDAGWDDYITKPFTLDHLMSRLAALLSEAR
jgi:DNA-binding response OmpR family regulator